MGSKNPERLIFMTEIDAYQLALTLKQKPARFFKDARGWIFFGPSDIRDRSECYQFCLQKLPKQKLPRVRVGCRYFTLAQAWKHWGVKKRRWNSHRTNECRQAVAIIRLMLLQAQQFGLLPIWSQPPKFDGDIIKPKRK